MFSPGKYSIVEPGANPMDDGRQTARRSPLLWLFLMVGILAFCAYAFTRCTRDNNIARAASMATPTPGISPTLAQIYTTPTRIRPTETPQVIIRTVIVPQMVKVQVTKIIPVQITRIVPVQQTVIITQLITATMGPTQTPWIITVPVTVTPTPTETPTETPTITPTGQPTETPTITPTETPTDQPTPTPTPTPTETPIETPTETPTMTPTLQVYPGDGSG